MDQLGIWKLFIKEINEGDAFKLIQLIDFQDFQIPNEKLTLEEIPNLDNCHELHISQFALTYNAYEDEELFDKYHKISLQHLRALLFFLQRQEHFSGPSKNYVPDSKKIISDIIKLVK